MRAILLVLLVALPARAIEPLHIQDNSFLIEEAYNQEPGVIQYIFTYNRNDDGNAFATFTNEFPVTGVRHQLSYTIAGARVDGDTSLADTLINYRYQLVGDGTTRLAISPRVSATIPTGKDSEWGWEVNLPVSFALTDRVVTHWNAGARSGIATFVGGSVIGAVREKFHVMLETLWVNDGDDSEVVVSPGIRWAWDLPNGFQIVPGIAVPIGENNAVFLYLSVER